MLRVADKIFLDTSKPSVGAKWIMCIANANPTKPPSMTKWSCTGKKILNDPRCQLIKPNFHRNWFKKQNSMFVLVSNMVSWSFDRNNNIGHWATNFKTWRTNAVYEFHKLHFSITFIFCRFPLLLNFKLSNFSAHVQHKVRSKRKQINGKDRGFCKIMCVCQFEGEIHFHKLTDHRTCYIT